MFESSFSARASAQLLRRKMLQLLAVLYAAGGLLYTTWILRVGDVPSAPWPSAVLALLALAILAAGYFTGRYRALVNILNVGGFLSFATAALLQRGILSPALWWIAIPSLCSLLWGSYVLCGVLVLGSAALMVGLYLHGPASVVPWASLASQHHYEQQVALAALASSIATIVLMSWSIAWIRRIQRRLVAAEDTARAALKAKSQFLANISHEIRTPLNAMVGATELLRSPSTPETQKPQLLAAQHHSAKMLLALVNDILDFSRLEAGKTTAAKTAVRIRRLVFETSELFSVQAFDKGIDITCSRSPDAPRVVFADEAHLRQIISNLVSNAIKFTENGGVHVHLAPDRKSMESAGTPLLRIEVCDSGIGIPPEKIGQLFSPYFQGDRAAIAAQGGTGLGLSISRELATLMGGRVEVTSTPGQGSTFTLLLPFEPAALPADDPPLCDDRALVATAWPGMQRHMASILDDLGVPAVLTDTMPSMAAVARARASLVFVDAPLVAACSDAKKQLDELASEGVRVALLAPLGSDVMVGAASGTSLIYKPVRRSNVRDFITSRAPDSTMADEESVTAQGSPQPWLRVLVAEDNPVNQLVVHSTLQNLHCAPVLVHNGLEAVQAVETEQLDLVLMDIEMPGMDGLAATRAIRAREKQTGRARLPVVAMTGASEPGSAAACLEAGMDRVLVKPFGLAQLRRVLDETAAASGGPVTRGE